MATKVLRSNPIGPFLWGYLRERIYATKPAPIPQLKGNIRSGIAEIEAHICESVVKNLVIPQWSCGEQLVEVIFCTQLLILYLTLIATKFGLFQCLEFYQEVNSKVKIQKKVVQNQEL